MEHQNNLSKIQPSISELIIGSRNYTNITDIIDSNYSDLIFDGICSAYKFIENYKLEAELSKEQILDLLLETVYCFILESNISSSSELLVVLIKSINSVLETLEIQKFHSNDHLLNEIKSQLVQWSYDTNYDYIHRVFEVLRLGEKINDPRDNCFRIIKKLADEITLIVYSIVTKEKKDINTLDWAKTFNEIINIVESFEPGLDVWKINRKVLYHLHPNSRKQVIDQTRRGVRTTIRTDFLNTPPFRRDTSQDQHGSETINGNLIDTAFNRILDNSRDEEPNTHFDYHSATLNPDEILEEAVFGFSNPNAFDEISLSHAKTTEPESTVPETIPPKHFEIKRVFSDPNSSWNQMGGVNVIKIDRRPIYNKETIRGLKWDSKMTYLIEKDTNDIELYIDLLVSLAVLEQLSFDDFDELKDYIIAQIGADLLRTIVYINCYIKKTHRNMVIIAIYDKVAASLTNLESFNSYEFLKEMTK